jgi:hypothetical protein
LKKKNFTREWKFHLISRQVKWVNTTFQKVEIKEKQISSRRRKIPTGGGGSSFRGESFFLFVSFSYPNTQVHFQTKMCNEKNINDEKYQSEIIDTQAYFIFSTVLQYLVNTFKLNLCESKDWAIGWVKLRLILLTNSSLVSNPFAFVSALIVEKAWVSHYLQTLQSGTTPDFISFIRVWQQIKSIQMLKFNLRKLIVLSLMQWTTII